MKLPSLNKPLTDAAKRLTEIGKLSPQTKWTSEETKMLIWVVVTRDILPEFGIDPKKTDAETKENLANAWKAFTTAFDEGYTVESSNLGRHLAAHGFCRKADQEAKQAAEVFV